MVAHSLTLEIAPAVDYLANNAHELSMQMRLEAAHVLVRAGLRLTEPMGLSHPAVFYGELGRIYDALGRYSEALAEFEKQYASYATSFDLDDVVFAPCLGNLATAHNNLGEHAKAYELQTTMVDILNKQATMPYGHLAGTYNNVSVTLLRMNRYDEALEYANKALVEYRNAIPSDHDGEGRALMAIANCQCKLRRFEDAIATHQQAITAFTNMYGQSHPLVATELHNIACALESLGRLDEAIVYGTKAAKVWNETMGPDHPQTKLHGGRWLSQAKKRRDTAAIAAAAAASADQFAHQRQRASGNTRLI